MACNFLSNFNIQLDARAIKALTVYNSRNRRRLNDDDRIANRVLQEDDVHFFN